MANHDALEKSSEKLVSEAILRYWKYKDNPESLREEKENSLLVLQGKIKALIRWVEEYQR